MAYFGQLRLTDNQNNTTTYLVGSNLYGTTNTNASTVNKLVLNGILGRDFDELILGITVNIQFIQGNTIENINLKVGNTATMPVHGNAKCNPNAILSFTYGQVNGTDAWILNAGEKTATTVMQHYDSSSTEPISGQGVAEAIAPLTGGTSAATLGVDTTIGNNPTNDKVPTSAAVAGYVTDAFGRVDALVYKGTLGAGGDISSLPSSGYSAGWLYKVISRGTYAGEQCEIGDIIFATHDAGTWQSAVDNSHWTIIQKNIINGVSSSGSATEGHIAAFGSNSTTIVDSGHTLAADVPQNAVFTDTTYDAATNGGLSLSNANEFSIDFGTGHNQAVRGDDARLSDDRAPLSHTHGNITNDGKLAANTKAVVTNDEGEITTRDLTTTVADPAGNNPIYVSNVEQDAQGKLTINKNRLPDATTSVAGITTVGAAGGAAAYDHNHDSAYATANHTHTFTGHEGEAIYADPNTGNLATVNLTTNDPTANGTTNTFIDTITQDSKGKISATKKSLSVATNESIGGIKVGFIGSNNRHFAVQLNEDNQAYVNVPSFTPSEINFGDGSANRSVVTDATGSVTIEDLTSDSNDNNPTNIEFIKRVQVSSKGIVTTTKAAIPTVGNGQAGIAPAGTTVNNQTQSTKFLREDGTWEAPSYTTNTDSKVSQLGVAETAQAGPGEDLHILLKKSANTTDEIDSVKYVKTQDAHVTINTKTGKVSAPVFEGTNSTTNAIHFIGKATSAGSADTAAQVPWTGVQNTPTTLQGYGITDAATSIHTHGKLNNNGTVDHSLTGSTIGYAVVINNNNQLIAADLSVTANDPTGTTPIYISEVTANAQGKISVTKNRLPAASDSVAGIVKLGASGGAATYGHDHDNAYAQKLHTHGALNNDGTMSTASVAVVTDNQKNISLVDMTTNDPSVVNNATATEFISNIAQNSQGKISTLTKKKLPTASSSVAGIMKLGASGGAATYDHNHDNTYAPKSHTHGNIQNGGTLQTTDVAIADGDKLVITDLSDSSKIARASISFDGATATQALTRKGTWETFNNYSHPTTSGNKHIPSGGSDDQILEWASDGTAQWYSIPDLRAIEALTGTTGLLKKIAANTWTLDTTAYTTNTGTVTSVQVQASNPLQSSTSTASSTTLSTTISFKNQDANLVLAGPATGNAAAPTFRALVAADIPNLSASKITSGTFANDRIANPKVTIAGNEVSLGGSLASATLRSSLGLTSALRFIGITSTTMTDPYTGTPAISGLTYTPAVGDVVIDNSKNEEYVCISVSGTTYTWERLGRDNSFKLTQGEVTTATAETTTATTFVYSVTQNANGVITVKTRPLPTYNNYSHPTGDGNLHVPATGTTNSGKFLKAGSTAGSISWAAITAADIADVIKYYNNHNNNIDTFNDTPYLQTAAKEGGNWSGTKPTDSHNGVALFNFHTHNGNYYSQLALDTNQNRLWMRSANNASTYGAWAKVAYVSDIPTNLNQLTNGPGYVTSSGVTSITIKTTSPITGGSNTATTSTGTYTIGIDTSGTWSGAAGKITNLGTGDAASNTATQRYVWFSYDDNTTGRPAHDSRFTYQTSTGTLFVGSCLDLRGATNATMTTASTNPRIVFSESGSQPVHLIYTDYDSYRSPAGLKVIGGASASPAWFEVEGNVYGAKFVGPLEGNADTATTATNLAAKPSLAAGTTDTNKITVTAGNKTSSEFTVPYATTTTSATRASYLICPDTRSTAIAPQDLTATTMGVRFDFKQKSITGLDANYSGVMSYRPYASNSDWSGGPAHQLAFDENGLHRRKSTNSTTWGTWYNILDSGNTYAANSNGTAVSVARNTDTTIATINGVAVKIKIPASDNTWRPIGTGASDAMAGNTNVNNVSQGTTTTSNWRKILLSGQDYAAYNTAVGNDQNTVTYRAVGVSVQPSTGSMQLAGGLELHGHIAGDAGSTGHGLWSGGGYHNAYNNIILHGDASTGTSGIAFVSDKGAANLNQPSDRAFIQWHGNGVTTFSAENANPTLATSGEANQLIIGVGNDANDQVRLQTPDRTGLLHQVGNTGYVIPDTNNTTGNVGDAYTPVYVNGGAITATTVAIKMAFTIASAKKGIQLNHTAFTTASVVSQIVITSGESNINAALSWESGAGWIKVTTTAAVSGAVTGYIVVIRGGEISATSTADIA